MGKKSRKTDRKNFHEELEGFDIRVNEFGALESSMNIDKINAFLNENVEDKKLKTSAVSQVVKSTEEEE